MNICVTGATGFTGKRVLPLLEGKGRVRCFVRKTSNVECVRKCGYEITYGDLNDVSSLEKAMNGCDVLLNIASLGFGHGAGIVNAAENAGIKRAIFVSTTALFTQLDVSSKSIRQQAEDQIRSSNLKWTIVRPTMIYGAPDDRNMIKLIKFIDKSPCIPVLGSGKYLQQPIFVEDLAKAIVGALISDNAIGKVYNVSGKQANTYCEIIDMVAAALGKKVIKVYIPFKIALYMAQIYEKLSKKPVIRAEQVMRLNENKDFEHRDAMEFFGFSPISFREGIKREVALYRNGVR